MFGTVREMRYGKMLVKVFRTRDEMGAASAEVCAREIKKQLTEKEEVNILFPCAYSHMDFFKHFFAKEGIDWSRVNAFVMDEYLGLEKGSPYILADFAREHIFSKAGFKGTYTMDATNKDYQGECNRYALILKDHPFDMVCLGIGETGHIAYNDPDVADFNDPETVKYVKIDEQSRKQAVHDGAFPDIDSVPHYAMTVTIPVMTASPYIQVVVPTAFKKDAVYKTCNDEISTKCPATILRNYDCVMYLDEEAAQLL